MKKQAKQIEKILSKINPSYNIDSELQAEFNKIITNRAEGYQMDSAKLSLKAFLEDMQKGGCISGMIGEFVYHSNCKEFYIKFIDELEDYKTKIEESIGESVKNRHNLNHYTFVVWLCFEEYCYNLYYELFEN